MEKLVIDQENGLLPIVTFDENITWSNLLRVAAPHLDQRGLERLKICLQATTKCVAVERHYIDKDYRDTFANFHAKKFSTPDARCVRLHFFSSPLTRDQLHNAATAQGCYLGYSVIRPTRPNCVGRTLLEPNAVGLANCHICLCTEEVSIQGTVLEVPGFPFISQDAEVTVCAQSALWMLTRYFSNRYHVYPEMYPFRLTALTKDYSIGRLVPAAGLYVWQMAEALRQVGYAPVIYDCHDDKNNFKHIMYTYIESGIPILAAFNNHVVVLFGHRSDFSSHAASADPQQKILFSSGFNREFIGNDDNEFPYQALVDTVRTGSMNRPLSDVERFIAALPERVFLRAEGFEALVTNLLLESEVGFRKFSPTIARAKPILRMFLATGRSFKKRIANRGMGHRLVAEAYRNLPLPHFIWICEISHPEFYPAKILGEVIWDATRNAYERDGWIAVHYPEFLALDAGAALNKPQNLVKFPLVAGVEYPIFENNLRRL